MSTLNEATLIAQAEVGVYAESESFVTSNPEAVVCWADDLEADVTCSTELQVDKVAIPKTWRLDCRIVFERIANQVNLPELKRNESIRDDRKTDCSWYGVRNGPAPPFGTYGLEFYYRLISVDLSGIWMFSLLKSVVAKHKEFSLSLPKNAAAAIGSILPDRCSSHYTNFPFVNSPRRTHKFNLTPNNTL